MANSKADKPKITPAEVVAVNATERLINQLKENGSIAPSSKMTDGFLGPVGAPQTMSGYKYRNSNNFILLTMAQVFDPSYGNIWGSYKQIKNKGGAVKPSEIKNGIQIEQNFQAYNEIVEGPDGKPLTDETGKKVTRFKRWPFKREEQKELIEKGYKPFWCNRYQTVYNIRAQSTGLDKKYYPEPIQIDPNDAKAAQESVSKVMELIEQAGFDVVDRMKTPHYIPKKMEIGIPPAEYFKDGHWARCSTLLHEYSHGLGDPSYLCYNGSTTAKFGTTQYAHEELRAEITAVCLSAQMGLPYTTSAEGHATSYVDSWIKVLSDDPMYLMRTVRDVVKTISLSNNLNQDAKPFYEALDLPFHKHLVSTAVAAGTDIESALENMADGKMPGFMHGTDFHISTIASVYASEMGLATGFSYVPGHEKDVLDDIKARYHNYAKGEATKAIDSIEAAFDAGFEDEHEPSAPKIA